MDAFLNNWLNPRIDLWDFCQWPLVRIWKAYLLWKWLILNLNSLSVTGWSWRYRAYGTSGIISKSMLYLFLLFSPGRTFNDLHIYCWKKHSGLHCDRTECSSNKNETTVYTNNSSLAIFQYLQLWSFRLDTSAAMRCSSIRTKGSAIFANISK